MTATRIATTDSAPIISINVNAPLLLLLHSSFSNLNRDGARKFNGSR
jgi:hypothetical protein